MLTGRSSLNASAITGSTAPGENSAAYAGLYPIYRELYPTLKPTYRMIAAT